ncbi:MAG TPA: GNAT family N-acetyltransferase [Actinocrinis sp.]|jgi:GNAT superfamily N-acetyltransferase|uniref:GNAT family N-acetyltransferase n=1 Tax=Actinocrinis sp. TaxID=1920516 RepID=UPI002DDD9ADC|nr:GNAT family N-acetyltransferase [Actinocrinis sp.]HEV3169425.1 GNAT family N-acetyltransferase [Actinocrinis sp.]
MELELEFTVDPELTDALREQIVACWTDVSNAGGAVGFVPPVTMDDVSPVAVKALAGVAAGRDRLIVGRASGPGAKAESASGSELRTASELGTATDSHSASGPGPDAERLAAVAFITDEQFQLTEHWRTVKRVMVHPDFQRLGMGARLMAEVEQVGREMGLEQLVLDCRGGTGNDEFYKKCGYEEYGRMRAGLRLSADDYRDRIMMALEL